MLYNRFVTIMKSISGILASGRRTIAYGLMALLMSSTLTGCSGQIYAALFEDNNMLLYALLLGGPKVKLTSTPAINNANVGSYVVSGTCSEDGQPVTVNITDGTNTVTATPACTAGAYTADSWIPAVSGLSDSLTIRVTADHANVDGKNARQARATVIKDTLDPTVTITSTAPNPTNTTIPITITFSETVTGFEVGDITVGNGTAGSFSGSGTTYTATITPAADGLVTVDVNAAVAQDVVGNPNTAATQLTRTYDTNSLLVNITSAAPDPTNAAIPITITFTRSVADFDVGDITVGNGNAGSFAGSGTTYTATITPSGQGLVTVDVNAGVAQDGLGNLNLAATQLTRTYDSNDPTMDITAPVSGASVSGAQTISFTQDESTTAQVSVDGTNWVGVTSGVTDLSDIPQFAGLPQGSFTLYLRGTDAAGNVGTDTIPLTKDTQNPTMDITAPTSDSSVNGTQTISFTQNESTTAQVSVDGTNWISVTSGVTDISDIPEFAGLGQGSFTLYLRGTDAAGNVGTDTITLTKDTQNPTMDITAPTSGSSVNGTQTISFTQNESTTAEVSVDGTNWVSVTSGVTTLSSIPQFAGLGQTSFTLYLRGTDAAGNTGTDSISLTKDTVAPTVAITAPTDGATVSGVATITFTDNDTNNPQVSVDGTNWTTASGGMALSDIPQFAGLTDGGFTLYLRDTDTAGNTGTDSISLTKSTSPPTITTAETMDIDHDGKIDHYKLTMSKNVDDSTFPGYNDDASLGDPTTEWVVGVYDNRQFVGATYDSINLPSSVDDSVIYIAFDENGSPCNDSDQSGCDSDDKPNLTTSASPGLKDLIGNTIAQVGGGTVTEADGARPILVKGTGINNISASIMFSEDVQAGTAECGAGSSQSGTDCSTIYTITGGAGLTVESAIMSGGAGVDGNTVVLETSPQTDTQTYTVAVADSRVRDLATNFLVNSSSITFIGQPPALEVLSAAATNNTTVSVTFNDNIDAGTAQCSGSSACASIYTIESLSVTNAVMSGGSGVDGTTVILTTTSHTTNTPDGYTLTVTSGVVENATNTVSCSTPDNTATFTGDTLPYLLSASSLDATHIYVTYSEDVKWDTSATGALLNTNYCIELASDGTPQTCDNPQLGTITAAEQTPDTVVELTTSGSQVAGTLYRVTVQNVVDTTSNPIDTSGDANTQTFSGLEDIKIVSASAVNDSSTSYAVFRVTFSKAPKVDGTANSVNYTGLVNWSFPAGLNTVTLCTPANDPVCPTLTAGDTSIYFIATPEPNPGAYTVVGATAVGSPPGAVGCIQNHAGSPACLQTSPNDRASLTISLPENIGQGPVYDDPFNDYATVSGQVLKYNNKLIIGPNYTDSGVFQVDNNLTNSVNITLDADNGTSGNQAFAPPLVEHTGVTLAGIDYMYSGCYDSTGTAATNLTGTACTSANPPNSVELFIVLGYITSGGNYQSQWISKNTTSPFIFTHTTGITNAASSYRAMSVQIFNGYVYHATQHQGSSQVRFDRLSVNTSTLAGTPIGGNGLNGEYLNRIGCGGSIVNGRTCAGGAGELISIDSMYEHDNDGTGGNASQLYLAAGGECLNTTSPNRCLTDRVRNATSRSDGGILRSALAHLPAPASCTSAADCATKWEDVSPDSTNTTYWSKWASYMSIPLPSHAQAGYDWDYIVPANTITPSIKAFPKMATFNGDLYVLRNACSSANINYVIGSSTGIGTVAGNSGSTTLTGTNTTFLNNAGYDITSGDTICVADPSTPATIQCRTVNTVTNDTSLTVTVAWSATFSGYKASRGNFWSDRQVCPSGSEKPQLWRLRQSAGSTAANARANWELVAENASTGRTDMTGATWSGGTTQSTRCARNTQITLLAVNGSRLYVGFDNGTDGVNIWRTKSGVTRPTSESDFEAVCQDTGTVCSVPSKQFGWAGSNTKIFDGISVLDGASNYLIISARNGTNPLRIYRTKND